MTRSPNGDLRTCVYSPPLEGEYTNILSAFKSDEMETIRQEMRDGKRRPECEWCYFYDESNQYSCRQDINERYPEPPSTQLRELDFAASNKCNYICVTCDESASSGWEQRNKEFRFAANEIKHKLPADLSGISNLKQLTIMGGEPTIEPYYTNEFWDLIESKTDKNLWFQMVTNCSAFPSKRWMDFLSGLEHVSIGISLDGIGEVGEFCRLGWKERPWRKNFLKWMKFFDRGYELESRHDGPWINIVLNNYNILFSAKTLKYVSEFGMRHRVMLTTAFEPDYLCPAYLPDKFKEEIELMEYFDDNHRDFVIGVLKTGEYSEPVYKKFQDYTKYLNAFVKVPEPCLHFV
jgi:sulfatase maturation enzyme AslB (radical SAM superfamily)